MAKLDDNENALLDSLPSGFRKRTWATAKLGMRLGRRAMRKALRQNSTSAEELANDVKVVASAEKLTEQLDELKGLAMKLGQMSSYLAGAMPEPAQQVLTRLQSQSKPMRYERVAEVVAEAFGESPEKVFETFEPQPFAAASIGQVHRATLDGQPVAVKIQYPEIEGLMASDLKAVKLFARLLMGPTMLDGGAIADELRERLLEECNYRREALHQQLFSELLEPMSNASVPGVYIDHCRKKVLTSAFVPALSFERFCETADQATKNRAAATIFDVCFTSLFRYCIYNADPHPGNYLLREDGFVTFLDFGCVRHFTPEMIDAWKAMALTVFKGDREGFRRTYPALGMVREGDKKFDWDYQWEMMRYLYRPFTSSEFTYTDDYVKESYDLLIFKNRNKRRSLMPAEWLFLNRLQWGLNSILSSLDATANWGEMWEAAITSPTTPRRPAQT